jgi:ribosomal protein L3 glutamine methyltransferase
MTLLELIEESAAQLEAAGLAYGHGTANAFDEAAWLVLWALKLPLDSDLSSGADASEDFIANRHVTQQNRAQAASLLIARITSRKPAAYLTKEAWLQGVPFYVDERVIVPRSFIAELLVDESIDPWLSDATHNVLDICTGNGSLAVLAAMAYPLVQVVATDISQDALDVAAINVAKHALHNRITLAQSDGLRNITQKFDLILCNPPYVNSASMQVLPQEYIAEPHIALAGGNDGMDFIRPLLRDLPCVMTPQAVLVLEIGNERTYFERAFPRLEVMWLETSAGDEQVLLVTREALLFLSQSKDS